MELVSPDLAVVASDLSGSTSSESPHVAGTDIVVSRTILAHIGGKEGIELKLSVLIEVVVAL